MTTLETFKCGDSHGQNLKATASTTKFKATGPDAKVFKHTAGQGRN